MIPVLLTQIKTSDGVTLDGIYVPPKRKSKTALIWIHGLSSFFYSGQDLIKEVSLRCQKQGIGYFKLNTRGHDLVTRGQGKHPLLGTLYEKFEDCVLDIRTMIGLARKLGYKNIVLAGHSTGANKVAYYLYRTKDKRIKGLILLGPVNDISAEIARVGQKEFQRRTRLAKRLYKKDPNALFLSRGFIYSARRYLGLYTPGKAEDVFPYYNPKTSWKTFRSIRVPLAVIFGSREEHTDRHVKDLLKIFQTNAVRAKSFSGIIIKGAGHSFRGKEKELAKIIVDRIRKI